MFGDAARRVLREAPPYRVVQLAITAFLAVAFSVGAIASLTETATTSLRATAAWGIARTCTDLGSRAAGSCVVMVTAPAPLAGAVKVDSGGPFDGLGVGRSIDLWVFADGTAEVGGWRSWVDGVSLAVVALIPVVVATLTYRSLRRMRETPTGKIA